jgi:hypothetical protein
MFNKICASLAIILIVVSQAEAQQTTPVSGQVKVPRGTVLNFTLLQGLDSATAKVGDDVALQLESPLVVDGVTLLPVGEVVHGRVTKVKRVGPRGRDGEVDLKLKRIRFADGTTAKATVGYLGEPFWVLVILSPLLPFGLLYNIADMNNQPRRNSGPGNEFLLPANSTVPITITKDHRVRF